MKEGTVAMRKKLIAGMALLVLVFFTVSTFLESSAWARAGGGSSMGSRGGRSFSSPSTPSNPSTASPGLSTPGRNPSLGTPGQPSGGFFSRSPFMQGLAGGLAGGMLGSLLFGGMGHASSGGTSGGGMGLSRSRFDWAPALLRLPFFQKATGPTGRCLSKLRPGWLSG